MAPPQHEIWSIFSVAVARIKGAKLHPDASCNACGNVVKNVQPSSNMLRHVLKCDQVSADSKARWFQYDALLRRKKAQRLLTPPRHVPDPVSSTPSVTKRLFNSPQAASVRTSSRMRRRNSSSKTVKQKNEDNFLRVAMGFIATGIAFRVIDDPYFRSMFVYELPSRRQLSGRLLDKIYDREMARMIGLLSGVTELALITDGWSNTNGDSIINFVFVNPKTPPIFWKSINTKAEVHTGHYIADTILSTITELEAIVGIGIVTAVGTDNAANMKKAWKLVSKECQGIVCTGCTAHSINLLMKDIFQLKFFKDVLGKAQKLARFIKNRRGFWSRFRDTLKQLKKKGEKRRRLTLTVPTRWYTHEKCVANVFHNRDVIAAIFADTAFLKSYEGPDLDASIAILKDETFWQRARVALKLIRPINTTLAAFECDDCSISMVYHQLEWLRTHDMYTMPLEGCNKELQQCVLGEIDKRREKVCSKTLGIANMLDQTKSMDYQHVEDAKTVINAATKLATKMGLVTEAQKDDYNKDLQEFVLEEGSWSGQVREDHFRYSPLNWWSLPSKKYILVRKFAKVLLSVPTSSASSERSWSIHGFIHTKLRNRLTPERVNKLVFVYTNIARKTEVNHIMYQLFPDACDDDGPSDSSDDDSSKGEDDNVQVECRSSALAMVAPQSMGNQSQQASDSFTAHSVVGDTGEVFTTPVLISRTRLTF